MRGISYAGSMCILLWILFRVILIGLRMWSYGSDPHVPFPRSGSRDGSYGTGQSTSVYPPDRQQ